MSTPGKGKPPLHQQVSISTLVRGHCWSPLQKLPLSKGSAWRDMVQRLLPSSFLALQLPSPVPEVQSRFCLRWRAHSLGFLQREDTWSNVISDGKDCLCLSFLVGPCINQHQIKWKGVVKLCKTLSRHTHFCLIIIQLRSGTDRVTLNQTEKNTWMLLPPSVNRRQ